jgi:hypothetical protein
MTRQMSAYVDNSAATRASNMGQFGEPSRRLRELPASPDGAAFRGRCIGGAQMSPRAVRGLDARRFVDGRHAPVTYSGW